MSSQRREQIRVCVNNALDFYLPELRRSDLKPELRAFYGSEVDNILEAHRHRCIISAQHALELCRYYEKHAPLTPNIS